MAGHLQGPINFTTQLDHLLSLVKMSLASVSTARRCFINKFSFLVQRALPIIYFGNLIPNSTNIFQELNP